MAEPLDADRWLTHYDFVDPGFAADPGPVWRLLRERCPVAHSDLYEGFWVATRYEDVGAITHDTATFSSNRAGIPPSAFGEYGHFPPINVDPPQHTQFRRLLLSAFAPSKTKQWEPVTWDIAHGLIDKLVGRTEIDAAREFARDVPITVIARMLGVEESDGEMFAAWLPWLMETGPSDAEGAQRALVEMNEYMTAKIREHRASPKDDIMSFLMDTEVDGQRLSDHDLLGVCRLLLIAGIDTTWSSIGSGLHYLATHPDDRDRLVTALADENSPLWATAVEEFLRMFAPVSLGRRVTTETEINGQRLRPGERIMLPFGAANRDPAVFASPDEVLLDREVNRHYAFGVGVHRCLGSNLARMELRVALKAFLGRIPHFSIAPGGTVRYAGGAIRGPRELTLSIGPVGSRTHVSVGDGD